MTEFLRLRTTHTLFSAVALLGCSLLLTSLPARGADGSDDGLITRWHCPTPPER